MELPEWRRRKAGWEEDGDSMKGQKKEEQGR
jgi:hypothetical protein